MKSGLHIVGQAPASGQTSPSPERKDAARNRARILEAARALVDEKPLADICMDQLATAAGVGKGTIYRRFADRAAVWMALLDDSERALQDAAHEGFGVPRDQAARRLVTLFDALVGFALGHLPILAEAEASARPEAHATSAPWQWRRIELARLLRAAQRRGQADATLNPELFAEQALALLSPAVLQRAVALSSSAEVRAGWRAQLSRLAGVVEDESGRGDS